MMTSEYRKDKQRLSNKQQEYKEMEILIKKYMITKASQKLLYFSPEIFLQQYELLGFWFFPKGSL